MADERSTLWAVCSGMNVGACWDLESSISLSLSAPVELILEPNFLAWCVQTIPMTTGSRVSGTRAAVDKRYHSIKQHIGFGQHVYDQVIQPRQNLFTGQCALYANALTSGKTLMKSLAESDNPSLFMGRFRLSIYSFIPPNWQNHPFLSVSLFLLLALPVR